MSFAREATLSILAGAAAGACVLGLVGRAAMAAVALVTGNALNPSLRGLLEVAAAGTLLGILGGLLLLACRRMRRIRDLAPGRIVGVTLFLCSVLAFGAKGRIDFGSPVSLLTLAVAAMIFLAYGIAADSLLTRFAGGAGEKR